MNRIVAFPTESARLEARMKKSSLREVHSIVEQLTDKLGRDVLHGSLMQSALERTEDLSNQEIQCNDRIYSLKGEMGRLQIEKNIYAPSDLSEKLQQMRQKIASCPLPSTELLQKELTSLYEQWDHLQFLVSHPIAEELNLDSFQSNYIHRMFDAIHEIEAEQPKKAEKLRQELRVAEKLCKAAEEVYCGKGSGAYEGLPKEIKQQIKQHLSQAEGLAGAIASVLGEQIQKSAL